MNKIIYSDFATIKPNSYIKLNNIPNPNIIYTAEYFNNTYNNNTSYFKPEVRISRRRAVDLHCNINDCFEYGCGSIPLSVDECLSCYDPFVQKFNIFDHNKFFKSKALIIFDVLEHMFDPYCFLQMLPQRKLIVSIPIFNKTLTDCNDLVGWKHYKPNEHIWNFTYNGFVEFTSNAGWTLTYSGMDECPPRTDIFTFVFERSCAL